MVRRGVVVENSVCSFCGKEEESYRHLFFDYKFVWLVWSQCFEWLGVMFVFYNDPVSSSVNDVWSVIWVCVVSEIRKHKNNVIFFKRRVGG